MHLSSLFITLLLLFFLNVFTAASSNNPAKIITRLSIDCGSAATSATFNGREWTGDVRPDVSSALQIKGSSAVSFIPRSSDSADQVPYKTARISASQFSYTFHVSPGEKILRLHFNTATYKGFQSFNDLFNVEAGPFTLLGNFSASLTAAALGVNTFAKEFCISVEQNRTLTITFSPVSSQSGYSTYAFINGIEIIPVPLHLSYFKGGDHRAQVVGQKSLVYIDNTTALELTRRVNTRWEFVSLSDEFNDMLGMWGASPKPNENEIISLTWKTPVDVGFRYMVRIHFCDVRLQQSETHGVSFKVLINEMVVDSGIFQERDGRAILPYRDYVVAVKGRKQEGKRNLLMSLQSYDEFVDGLQLIKGFEIFKLSNPDNSLSSPNAFSPQKDSPSWIIHNLLPILCCRNATATLTICSLALINIIVHMLREICEASITEEENRPSARAERLCRRFSLAEMQSATKNFSEALLIGRGGFGKVYRGLIDNGRETVAIKRLKSYSKQGRHEFLTEIETLCELRHINLVPLIGYCSDHKEMILVYEFMPSGTLAHHLHKYARNGNASCSLTWNQRLRICIGAARGLDYLHTGQGVIHRDVKPSNILLDENFVPKVSDFGLAKREDRSNLQSHVSTKVKGTHGYFDPYYISTSKLTRKSDTYAFGVVLLEVLSERQALDPRFGEDEYCLTRWARNKINKGEVNQVVAFNLMEEILPESLKVYVEVAERCLHDEPKKRPTMAQVVVQLESALELQESIKIAGPNHIAFAANDVCSPNEHMMPSANIEQSAQASTDVHADTSPVTKKIGLNYSDHSDGVTSMDGISLPKREPDRSIDEDNPNSITRNRGSDQKSGKMIAKENGPINNLTQRWWWDPFGILPRAPSKSKAQQLQRRVVIHQFSLHEIQEATNDFNTSLIIGYGGLDNVYKGDIDGGKKTVAIKRSSAAESRVSMAHELQSKKEIQVTSSPTQDHVASLIGYCETESDMILIYEHMENGTLYDHLHDASKDPLPWKRRLQICIGAAQGLSYIHSKIKQTTLHRDLKSSNIWLDEDWIPKVSLWGLSKKKGNNQVSSIIKSNWGHLDSDYIHGEQSIEKSYVYSFGLILFEVLFAEKESDRWFDEDQVILALWIKSCMRNNLSGCIDPFLVERAAPDSLKIFIETAERCLLDYGIHRPSMTDIEARLEAALQLQEATEANKELT